MFGWFQALMPKEERFFPLFEKHAAIVVAGAVTSAIIGVGAARKVSAVRWNIAGNIVIAWIITLPATALVAALCYLLSRLFR
jgi:phosphate/sulfate permease